MTNVYVNVVGQFSRIEFKSDAIIFYVGSDPLYRTATFFEASSELSNNFRKPYDVDFVNGIGKKKIVKNHQRQIIKSTETSRRNKNGWRDILYFTSMLSFELYPFE